MDRAFIFDVFGTLVDWRTGVADVAAGMFADRGLTTDPYDFAMYWRSRYQPAMERVRSGGRGYVPLDQLHLENLNETLDHFGIEGAFDPAARGQLNRAWEQLPPWPDAVPGLTALRQRAFIAPCSNGSIALMARLARFAGFPWDAILGAEVAQDYKPKSQVYLASCAALGLAPERVVMVAAHNDDLTVARAAGLKTAFIPRVSEYGLDVEAESAPTQDWDMVVERIGDLAV
ncbi:haloacid dehalogenase type II [Pseudaestuariivita rosea]|uniref:haloacid dehalogenase type II n=1 Tax=Pseudaestuariivita rosea TaxID=2763263 RepID=UPI001ABBCBED|nr:haloacid dehalogenase type II [Pseudaestuariivita rosea]